MARAIRWSPRASAQLAEICGYIAQDSEQYAALFAKRIMQIVKSISRFPMAGRVVPEYGKHNLREKIYNNYRIVYRVKEERVEIVVITHGARLLEDIS